MTPHTPDSPELLAMPASAAYGWLADKAHTLDAPLGWAYCSLLAIYAGSITHNLAYNLPHVRSNIYVALVGRSATGKSLTQTRAIKTLDPEHVSSMQVSLQSGLGIQHLFKASPRQPARTSATLIVDEMSALIARMKPGRSILASALTSLYDGDMVPVAKEDADPCHARLSILAGLRLGTGDTFRRVMSASRGAELANRFIVVPAPGDHRWEHFAWRSVPEQRSAAPVYVPPQYADRMQAWVDAGKSDPATRHRESLADIGMRVAVLSASATYSEVDQPVPTGLPYTSRVIHVDDACFDAAMEFATWQERVRMHHVSDAGVFHNFDREEKTK